MAMESLALVVGIIVFVAIGIGPVAYFLTRSSRRGLQITGAILGVIGISTGFWMMNAVDSTGARFIWIFSALTSGAALWNFYKKQKQ
jgi:hypothetical protein